jgi:GNAT acetyltransferase-like protein
VADPFYALYLVSMKRLGVPPHPRRFFDDLAAGLGDGLVASWIMHEQQTAAVLLGAICGARLQIYITASSPKMLIWRPNDLAHWELIAWAASATDRPPTNAGINFHASVDLLRYSEASCLPETLTDRTLPAESNYQVHPWVSRKNRLRTRPSVKLSTASRQFRRRLCRKTALPTLKAGSLYETP